MPSNETAPLMPIVERSIPFHGDTIAAALVEGDDGPRIMVPVRPLCERLGLAWASQYARIRRDVVLAEAASVAVTVTDGRRRGSRTSWRGWKKSGGL